MVLKMRLAEAARPPKCSSPSGLSLDLDVLDKAGLKSFEDVLRIPEGELAPLMSAEQVTS